MKPVVTMSRLLAAGVALLVLSGCSTIDPYQRAGVWRPMGANEMNLELQVARSSDMVKGRATEEADGPTATAAVDRLYKDKVKPLPQSSLSKIGESGGGGK
jgi:type IV pilus biogenesis protein CpaD/CtpE